MHIFVMGTPTDLLLSKLIGQPLSDFHLADISAYTFKTDVLHTSILLVWDSKTEIPVEVK